MHRPRARCSLDQDRLRQERVILLKNLRSFFENLRTNGAGIEIIGNFSVHAERVEAFFGFQQNQRVMSAKRG